MRSSLCVPLLVRVMVSLKRRFRTQGHNLLLTPCQPSLRSARSRVGRWPLSRSFLCVAERGAGLRDLQVDI